MSVYDNKKGPISSWKCLEAHEYASTEYSNTTQLLDTGSSFFGLFLDNITFIMGYTEQQRATRLHCQPHGNVWYARHMAAVSIAARN